MIFSNPLLPATLIRRYKRFLADVQLPDRQILTVHCPNTGSMLGCAEPGMPVWLSRSGNSKRKYTLTWELVDIGQGTLVGINTGLTNRLVEEAIVNKIFPALAVYPRLQREVRYGREGSRVDFVLEGNGIPCYLEAKNVTAAVQEGIALFPDAVSRRASRHLRELMTMASQGLRAVLFFCVQRSDVREVRPADAIDPVYGATLREAMACGVEVMAGAAEVTPQAIVLNRLVPVICP